MNKKPTIADMEAVLEKYRRDKAKTDNPNPDLPKAAPTTSFRPKEVYSGPTKETVEPVEAGPAQVNPETPVAVPMTRRKPVDDNRGNLFLPDTPEPETPSIPKAASTDRRETEQMREKLHIYCFHCRQPTKHAEMPCDLEQYAADWLMYLCGVCGLKAYARKDLKEEEKRL